jgi:hypothetical protein
MQALRRIGVPWSPRLRHHVHYLVAARFELADQFRYRFGGVLLEIVHQHDAFAVLSTWFMTDLMTSSSLKSRESMPVENPRCCARPAAPR